MINKLDGYFSQLAPCVLMSPLSIAQYLPADQALYDVVIFDEASQITTWDAVGAIARGRQTIIVGDPKQLPPTNFFGRNDEDGEDVQDYEKDLESILDEARASGLPLQCLTWHYRSRHESLIAFSNWHYYENRLITFPSPITEDKAVSLRHITTGIYDRGKSRSNPEEARAIVREVVKRLEAWLRVPEEDRLTLGVITFNLQQQGLIQDLLDEERRANPELEWFFSDDRIEPLIVKNLENVQGDERDVMFFSITFCKDSAGKLTMDFGALNREGGERRLNVAVTRARHDLIVFSGITSDQIDLSRTKSIGVSHLKSFLDYAERGPVALPSGLSDEMGGATESPFEQAVLSELEKRGWHVIPQVGASGYRIDLAVRHPERPGAFLAGIECDGATYHRSATARDRDLVREQVLRGLGWEILRVWSTDWWFDPGSAADRLHQSLEVLLETSRSMTESNESISDFQDTPVDEALSEDEQDWEPESMDEETHGTLVASGQYKTHAIEKNPTKFVPNNQVGENDQTYRVTDLSVLETDTNRFFEASYRPLIQKMVDAVLETEAPIREDILYQRIARAHGWQRTGKRIRERIMEHLGGVAKTKESSGIFLWKEGSVCDRLTFRHSTRHDDRRGIPEICLAELVDVVKKNSSILMEEDPPLALSRVLQVERLAVKSRLRLEEAIEVARINNV
jgi:very-short-patch-repair endonuclease